MWQTFPHLSPCCIYFLQTKLSNYQKFLIENCMNLEITSKCIIVFFHWETALFQYLIDFVISHLSTRPRCNNAGKYLTFKGSRSEVVGTIAYKRTQQRYKVIDRFIKMPNISSWLIIVFNNFLSDKISTKFRLGDEYSVRRKSCQTNICPIRCFVLLSLN